MSEVLQLPVILSQHTDGHHATFTLEVPADLPYFQGHFPGFAILPGVVQLGWAEHLGRRLFPLPPRFLALEALKFQDLILPGYRLTLTLLFKSEKGKLEFSFASDAGKHSSGRLVFAE